MKTMIYTMSNFIVNILVNHSLEHLTLLEVLFIVLFSDLTFIIFAFHFFSLLKTRLFLLFLFALLFTQLSGIIFII